jgi:ABC-2 type transport system permease protein
MERSRPTFGQATHAMARLYFATLLRGRKTLLVGVIVAFGLLLSAIVGGVVRPSAQGRVYALLLSQLTLGFVAQFLGLFYGIAAVREDVESKTLTWLLVRPIPRVTILLGRWLAALATVCTVLVVFALASHLLAASEGDGPLLIEVIVAALLGGAYYTTVFTAIATLLPKPLVIGLGYVFFWEFALPLVPSSAATLSMKFHLVNLVGGHDGIDMGIVSFMLPDVEPLTSALVLVVATVVLALVSLRAFPRRELVTAD